MYEEIGMKKGDFLWVAVLGVFVAILVVPATHKVFMDFTTAHPYLGGFIKFAILATMGELLAIRITKGDWLMPVGVIYRMIIWGFLGMVITLIFKIFGGGIALAMSNGALPGGDSKLLFAFFVASIMNCTFGPSFMAFHRCTDTYIDLKYSKGGKISLYEVTSTIDWNGFVSFVVLKTIPFFWIPAHTITFLLPEEYRVLVAAALSIALGCILAFAKRKQS